MGEDLEKRHAVHDSLAWEGWLAACHVSTVCVTWLGARRGQIGIASKGQL